MPLLFLALAILCSAGNALTMKFAGARSSNARSLITFNYVTCVVLGSALVMGGGGNPAEVPARVMGLGAVNGILYILTFVLFQANIAKNGATVSSAASRLSVAIPVLFSIAMFGEMPRPLQAASLVMALVALVVMALPRTGANGPSHASSTTRWLLVPLVVSSGTTDVVSKIFERTCDHAYQGMFILVTFACALVISVVMLVGSKERPRLFDAACGVALGTFNYFSSSLLLRALTELPAFLVFTGFCLGVILVMNVANAAVLKERLSPKDYAAMALIVVSFALLYAPVG